MSREFLFLVFLSLAIVVSELARGRVGPITLAIAVLVPILWLALERSGLYRPRPGEFLPWRRFDERTRAVHKTAIIYTFGFLVLVLFAMAFYYRDVPVHLVIVVPFALALSMVFYMGAFVILGRRM